MDKKSIDETPNNKKAYFVGDDVVSEEEKVNEAALIANNETFDPAMRFLRIIICVMLVITGSVNTLAAKWADRININGRYFNHPFFQATVMFVGEMCCGVVFFVVLFVQRYFGKRRQKKMLNGAKKECQVYEEADGLKTSLEKTGESVSAENDVSLQSDRLEIPQIPHFNYFLFAAPAFCDVFATSLLYVGLTLTSAASSQMLRGAVIIFTGFFSVICLRMKLRLYQWLGILMVVVGLVIVGVADILFTHEAEGSEKKSVLVGDILVIFSQIIVAVQVVVEQKLLSDFNCPALLAVGLEGIFGFLILSILMVPMFFIHVPPMFSNSPENRLEDALDAFQEMRDSGELVAALSLTLISIAFFNFSGVSVTKYMDATTRMVLDSIRTIIIWAVSIPLFHSNFIPLQLLGFASLVFGMFMYNDVFIGPLLRKTKFGALLYPTV
ncbi:unnamed protein product [Thelazia callipaeda]|uniref:Solute carrier family 35 member F6 n=1 Tax=Thelazia callipaeda TaxID=103827 RepID=A0A0N5CW78_THECL|nr:unnamed protein product [Thelazia callipaeda]